MRQLLNTLFVTSEDVSKLQAEAEKRAEQKLNRLADT